MESLAVAIGKSYAGGPDSAPFDLAVGFETSDELTVLFGPSGAGKTLTLDCIAGFIAPDRGRVSFGAETLFDSKARVNLAARKRRIGYVFQKDALFPHMTLRGNLEFAARPESNTETGTIEETLERFGLASLAGRRPHQVSGGERQRCSIARILVSRPRLILLDEPARGLDVSLREQLYAVLAQVRAQDRLPMILVTHDLEEAFALGDRMLVYDRGRIIQDGSPAEVHGGPTSPAVARLLGISPIFEGVASGGESNGTASIEASGLRFPMPGLNGRNVGETLRFCIRTERVIARPAAGADSPNGVTLPLERATETPTHLRLEFPGGVAAEIPRQQAAAVGAVAGERWSLEFPPGSIWVFPSEQGVATRASEEPAEPST